MRWRATVTVVASLAFLGACSSKSDEATDKNSAGTAPATASTTPAAPPSSAAPGTAEKTAVLASYNAMWVEQMKAYRKADASGTDLEKYVSLDALGKFRLDLARMKKAGTVVTGELGHTPVVTRVDTSGKVAKAAISDCLDLAKWQSVYVKTNKPIPLPSNQPRRYRATATAEKWPSGWMVTVYTPHGEQPC